MSALWRFGSVIDRRLLYFQLGNGSTTNGQLKLVGLHPEAISNRVVATQSTSSAAASRRLVEELVAALPAPTMRIADAS